MKLMKKNFLKHGFAAAFALAVSYTHLTLPTT